MTLREGRKKKGKRTEETRILRTCSAIQAIVIAPEDVPPGGVHVCNQGAGAGARVSIDASTDANRIARDWGGASGAERGFVLINVEVEDATAIDVL